MPPASVATDTKTAFTRLLGILALLGFVLAAVHCGLTTTETPAREDRLTSLTVLEDAFENRKSNIQVLQEGLITAVLSDDTVDIKHQRIIVELSNRQTLLIAHNIDIAPRVPDPTLGDLLKFYGEYEWNNKGGVIHWTHRDPDKVHVDGWLEYEGKRYQ